MTVSIYTTTVSIYGIHEAIIWNDKLYLNKNKSNFNNFKIQQICFIGLTNWYWHIYYVLIGSCSGACSTMQVRQHNWFYWLLLKVETTMQLSTFIKSSIISFAFSSPSKHLTLQTISQYRFKQRILDYFLCSAIGKSSSKFSLGIELVRSRDISPYVTKSLVLKWKEILKFLWIIEFGLTRLKRLNKLASLNE